MGVARYLPDGSLVVVNNARAFVDYLLSDAGQAVVTQVGYYPVR